MKTRIIIFGILMLATTVIAESKETWTKKKVSTEINYADKLSKLGLNKFADDVIIQIPVTEIPPELMRTMKLLQFQTYLRKNIENDKAVNKYIKKEAKDDAELFWILQLRWADELWTRGETEKCLAIYKEFMSFYDQMLEKSKEKRKDPAGIKKEMVG